jgi:hypothetical protein
MPTLSPIAIDVGHGWTKIIRGSQRLRFPSLIAVAPPTLDLGEHVQSKAIVVDGQPYLVGEAARPYATPLWAREKATEMETLLLMVIAAASVQADGPVRLATGLPLTWYGSQRKTLQAALEGLPPQTITLPQQPPRTITIAEARVLPQAVSAAIALLGEAVMHETQILLIDIGYRTTDYLVVQQRPRKPLDFAANLSGTIEVGMSLIAETLAVELENTYHIPFALGEVETAARLMIKGRPVDLIPLRQQARQLLVTRVYQELSLRLKDHLDRMHRILLVGGGASDLTEPLRQAFAVPVDMATDPQWANALGYWGAIAPAPSVPVA